MFAEKKAMKKYVAAIAITILSLTGCASLGSKEVAVPQGLDTYSGLSAALAGGDKIFLYDVRTSSEYESGHIPGAVNISYADIAEKLPISRKNDVIVVYCARGGRSYMAHQWLSNKGFKYVVDFGALRKWDGELVKGPDQYISK
jgi:rhodanese-related sulfurtransferase